jgi:hypothetical protein
MTKSLWIILVVLLTTVGASNAHADSFNVTFQCTGTCTAPALPVATNNPISFPSPTIDVLWEGNGFALTFTDPGDKASDAYIWDGFLDDFQLFPGSPTFSVDLIFIIQDTNTGNTARDEVHTAFESPIVPEVVDNGTVVITPEPGSLALLLAGVGLVFLMRKVMGHRLPQTS